MTGRSRLPEPPRSGHLTVLAEQDAASRTRDGVPSEILAAISDAERRGGLVAFVPGARDLDDLQTLAGLALLERVARRRGPHRVRFLVPVACPLVLRAVSRLLDGRPGSRVAFVSGDPIGFAAGAAGMIRRESPDAVVFAGAFSAEAILLVAAAHEAGARTAGGTARLASAPVFRIGCDGPLPPERLWDAAIGDGPREPQSPGALLREAARVAAALVLAAGALVATLRSPAGERIADAARAAAALFR